MVVFSWILRENEHKTFEINGLCSFGDEFLFTCCRHEACLKQGLMNLSDCSTSIRICKDVLHRSVV